jgi:hypothetical protein
MPSTDIETIDGHLYRVTRDDAGAIVSMAIADPLAPVAVRPLHTKAKQLIQAPLPLTATQRDRALQIITALLLDLGDA